VIPLSRVFACVEVNAEEAPNHIFGKMVSYQPTHANGLDALVRESGSIDDLSTGEPKN
jgi:hypothetical protein